MKNVILTIVIMVLASTNVFSQDQPSGKVHGYVFGDYYYKMSGDKSKAYSTTQYSDSALTKAGGFQLRRIYLYYEHAISENFQAQFLLEGNDGAVDGKGRHGVFVKLANLEWKNILPEQSLVFGMIGTPTWALSEKVWGYRSVEKTIADMRGLGGASDIGVALKGKFGSEGMFGYTAMVSNGNGQKPENNKTRKYYGSFTVKPIKSVIVEAYADYESGLLNKQKNDKKSITTLKGFAAYQVDQFTVGLEAFQQTQKKFTDTTDVIPFGFTLFAWAPIMKDKLKVFARFDTYNPDTEVTKAGYKENFITLGLDYMAHKNVHIMPNIWMNSFSKKTGVAKRDGDVVARVTFFYVYK